MSEPDLVAQLREMADQSHGFAAVLEEAAVEIEQLRRLIPNR